MDSSQMAEHFLRVSRIEKNLSPRTLRAYRSDLNGFWMHIGNQLIENVDVSLIRDYLEDLETRGLNGSSIKRKLATLKVFFLFLEDEKLIHHSPVRKFKRKFRTARRLPRVMSIEEIQKILIAANNEATRHTQSSKLTRLRTLRDRAMLELLFCTGIRIDELVKLDISDLNLPAQSLVVFGKGRKERRLFLSSQEVITALQTYLEQRLQWGADSQALFLNRLRVRIGTSAVRAVFQRFTHMTGLPSRFTPHCLRHSMATMLIENGADVRSVQEILGHSRISTTEIYLTVSQQRRRDVLTRYNGRNSISVNGQ